MLQPHDTAELAEMIRVTPRILACGSMTKPALSRAPVGWENLSLQKISGITEHQPSEYVVSVKAGTTVAEVQEVLARAGQYLPFDPILASHGATIGGTIAAGSHGPGRQRYGGIRDFILGVTFVDGRGRMLRGGGKVVKNAAGFDLPKFLVNSAGSLAVITEVTFKVFPKAPSSALVQVAAESAEEAVRLLSLAASAPCDARRIGWNPGKGIVTVVNAGHGGAPLEVARRMATLWGGKAMDHEAAESLAEEDERFFHASREGCLVRAALQLRKLAAFQNDLQQIAGLQVRYEAAGDLGWLVFPEDQAGAVAQIFLTHGCHGMALRGKNIPLLWGTTTPRTIDVSLKQVFDPDGKFPGLDRLSRGD